jgi:hypothetical protein
MKHVILVGFTFALIGFAAAASAQTTVINPTTAVFNPSADHTAVIDTQPVVERYELRIFVQGATTSTAVINLGKPTPSAGVITTPFSVSILPLSATIKYVAYVAAMGPTGEGVSGASNLFMRVGPPGAPSVVVVSK